MEIKERNRRQKIVIMVLMSAVITLSIGLYFSLQQNDNISKTAVIVQSSEKLNDMRSGQLRIRINSAVQIYGETMQDLAFANLNKDRQLQCKIKVGDICVYDSGFVKSGDIVQADVVDISVLQKGKNPAIAEIYNYNMEHELIGQTNTMIELYLND